MKAIIFTFFLLISISHSAFSADAVETRCHKLYRLSDLSHAMEPGVLIPASDALPAYCRVRGVINSAIRFEVTLPVKDWNGRMMFSAVGGDAGVIGDTTSLLHKGFAMASTDTGHEASAGKAFYRQPEALLNYAYRGVHLSTLAAKKTISHFYGADIDYAYLNGCSNGGRAALLEAERYPEDYDGIIAGAPLFRFEEMSAWMMGQSRAQQANPLTADTLLTLDKASKAACDLLDGVADGVINDPRKCTADVFDLSKLQCNKGQQKNCLTAGQLKTAESVYSDVKDAQGNIISPGVLPGAEAAGDWAFWQLPNKIVDGKTVISTIDELVTLLMRHEPGFDVNKFDTVNDRYKLKQVTAALDVYGDLSEFRANGGKLLMYQGWNDYPLRPQRAIDYLSDIENELGGRKKVSQFFRLFMVPGMNHCAGGPGAWMADYVAPLVDWREEGNAPDRIIAQQPGKTIAMPHLSPAVEVTPKIAFSRPLCVYPKLAKFKGIGDKNDEKNFSCVQS
ncbi:MAG: tannase/feruloyl esterase family alpha/beta hydrolase [Pseudomonadales bacterium]|nr:tannase/feruloyl esterase family alpha/beta hydrolase [Pseudomonadales bacterium]